MIDDVTWTHLIYQINLYIGIGFTKHIRDRCTDTGVKGWVKNSKRGTIMGKMQGFKPEVDKM